MSAAATARASIGRRVVALGVFVGRARNAAKSRRALQNSHSTTTATAAASRIDDALAGNRTLNSIAAIAAAISATRRPSISTGSARAAATGRSIIDFVALHSGAAIRSERPNAALRGTVTFASVAATATTERSSVIIVINAARTATRSN